MSFGISISDFIAVGTVARELYRDIYLVARGAPEELQSLMTEIGALSQLIDFLVDEIKDPGSILVSAGEHRCQTVNDMMKAIRLTLDDMEKLAAKHQLINKSAQRSKLKRGWDKVKWASDLPSVNSLRSRISYQNGVLSLLLTLAKKYILSSLERIQAQTQMMSHNIEGIKNLLTNSPTIPFVSVVDGEVSRKSLSWALLKEAEKTRPWLASSIDEWIQAGKWWLMKAQSSLYVNALTEKTVPAQSYTDLLKASWILVDIISQHPQQRYLSSTSGSLEAQVFAETVKSELHKIEALGLTKPNHEQISKADLNIWIELPPTVILNPREIVILEEKQQPWRTLNTQVYFQAFGYFRSKTMITAIECIILVLVDQPRRKTRIVGQVQKGIEVFRHDICMATPEENYGRYNGTPDSKGSYEFQFDGHFLLLNSFNGLCEKHYVSRPYRGSKDLEKFQGLMLLTAIASENRPLVLQLLNDETQSGKDNNIPDLRSEFEFKNIRELANGVATMWLRENESYSLWGSGLKRELNVYYKQKSIQDYSSSYNLWFYSLLKAPAALLRVSWIDTFIRAGFHNGSLDTALFAAVWIGDVAVLAAVLTVSDVVNRSGKYWTIDNLNNYKAIHMAARRGNSVIAKMLINHGADVNEYDLHEKTPIYISMEYGHLDVLTALLEHGADANKIGRNRGGALHLASEKGHEAMLKILLNHGASTEKRDMFEQTALHLASEEGHEAILKILLNHGANVNAATIREVTPLLIAVDSGDETAVRLLLNCDADTKVSYHWRTVSGGVNPFHGGRIDLDIEADSSIKEEMSVLDIAQLKVTQAWDTEEKQNAEKIVQLLIDHDCEAVSTIYRDPIKGNTISQGVDVVQDY
ncbi:hypothetical protein MMC17_007164 [Xylographa soralifera]|nr:hypothetical protein [Xylographa soralifera]